MKTYELKLTIIIQVTDDNEPIENIINDLYIESYNDNVVLQYDSNEYINGFKVDSVKLI